MRTRGASFARQVPPYLLLHAAAVFLDDGVRERHTCRQVTGLEPHDLGYPRVHVPEPSVLEYVDADERVLDEPPECCLRLGELHAGLLLGRDVPGNDDDITDFPFCIPYDESPGLNVLDAPVRKEEPEFRTFSFAGPDRLLEKLLNLVSVVGMDLCKRVASPGARPGPPGLRGRRGCCRSSFRSCQV